jgi:hypothetical protein
MRLEAGIHRVSLDDARTLRAEALENGWHVFDLPETIHSWKSFFEAVREAMPLNPPLSRSYWDVLGPALEESLSELGGQDIAIVRTGTAKFSKWYRGIAYWIALDVLDGAVSSLGGSRWERTHRVVVLLAR